MLIDMKRDWWKAEGREMCTCSAAVHTEKSRYLQQEVSMIGLSERLERRGLVLSKGIVLTINVYSAFESSSFKLLDHSIEKSNKISNEKDFIGQSMVQARMKIEMQY